MYGTAKRFRPETRATRAPPFSRTWQEGIWTRVDSGFEPHLERWEFARGSWLVLTAAAFSRSSRAMRARVRGFRAGVEASVSSTSVRHARAAVRSALASEARSPGGLAEVIGRHMDATGDAGAATRYLEELEGLDYEAMAGFLDAILAAEAVTAQVAG